MASQRRPFNKVVWTKIWNPDQKAEEEKHHFGGHQRNDEIVRKDQQRTSPRMCCGGSPCAAEKGSWNVWTTGKASFGSEADHKQNLFLSSKYQLPVALVENFRDVFNKFDTDNDHTVSGKELIDMFQTVGVVLTRQVRYPKSGSITA